MKRYEIKFVSKTEDYSTAFIDAKDREMAERKLHSPMTKKRIDDTVARITILSVEEVDSKESRIKEVLKILNDMDIYELIAIYRHYIAEMDEPAYDIYEMNEFNDIMNESMYESPDIFSPLNIAEMVHKGLLNPNHEYFEFEFGSKNYLESFNACDAKNHMDLDLLADYCVTENKPIKIQK